ncbi:bromodomain-containing protein [Coniochaeta ligniaria NRRL 30616]|uniref:SAGA complex subunit Spt7 n=1 Tax=Coniochaeta ligniaria NRRL 30616 TaxID=1408157 RepID=A0A1J7IH98_9PEZI|nr:bromodomain-containing protein [Coniochaeta ligniaria NRRL 30616]
MSFPNGQNAWHAPPVNNLNGGRMHHLVDDGPPRTQTPIDQSIALMPEASDIEEDTRRTQFSELFRKSEAKIALLFAEDGSYNTAAIESLKRPLAPPPSFIPPATDNTPIQEPPRKKAKRVIDEDDYGDDEEEEEDEGDGGARDADDEDTQASPVKRKSAHADAAKSLLSPSKSGSSPVHSVSSPGRQVDKPKDAASHGQPKTSEDARKELEEARNATEEAAKRSFHTLFYTLENDRTAMLEQQQLEESEKQLQAEMDKTGNNTSHSGPGQNHGSLSNANLGASSLTLKHLIARIDLKRSQVKASDAELRSLMNEVRKNRSKWASEENVGQEELYEALEKVLSELKAHTEYSTPFLNRVNKRDAPDYYNFIKHPMDLGTMTKKLKGLQYKSKAEFVTDLNLIWDNCLRYNQDMGHPLRRMANGMRKEAEKLIPLIPDLTIRPRAEVEAEERRKQNGGDDDGGDDSDDEPIMSSRGRKAGAKGVNKSRKAPSDQKEGTPNVEQKPMLQLNGLLGKPHREGSEVDGSNGFATPPIGGSITPSGINGHSGVSNVDGMDIDGPSLSGMALGQALGEAAEQAYEDEEYKIWKQVTKKDRALIAKERFQLFKNNKLNVDAPALLRTKGGMRRYVKSKRAAETTGLLQSQQADASAAGGKDSVKATESLAEGMEDQVERAVPDYYEPLTVIPDIPSKLQWVEDGEGQVINQHEEFLRLIPRGHFVAPESRLTKKFDDNIRQMQETRKLCSKIGVIKQMQIQTQVYTNQFPKHNLESFVEADIEPHYISGEGPVMAGEVCKAAMQRSVAKIFYHAGFEELQPSALEAAADMAGDYFTKLVRSFNVYHEAEKKVATGVYAERGARFQPRFTPEEVLLHTLCENGHELELLEGYARDDVPKLGSKLGVIHERMKAHLADLLRPALNDAGPDGAGAFNDGSEQFVGGDFAEDLGEDFFGFKQLGLDKEFGLEVLSVPFHLLQTRVRSQYQQQAQVPGTTTADLFDALPPLEPVTKENIVEQIGLVKNFFLAKLHANGDQPLVEDEDLPVKQRRPRPRLGATGKIVSPQKRPPKEQIALAKKKKKLESAGMSQAADGKAGVNASPEKGATPSKKRLAMPNGAGPAHLNLAPPMERVESMQSLGNASQTDKDEPVGMMSPESIER